MKLTFFYLKARKELLSGLLGANLVGFQVKKKKKI